MKEQQFYKENRIRTKNCNIDNKKYDGKILDDNNR